MRRRQNVLHVPATTRGSHTKVQDSASAPRTKTSTKRYGNDRYNSALASATTRSPEMTTTHQYIAHPDNTTERNNARLTPRTTSPERNANAAATRYASGG